MFNTLDEVYNWNQKEIDEDHKHSIGAYLEETNNLKNLIKIMYSCVLKHGMVINGAKFIPDRVKLRKADKIKKTRFKKITYAYNNNCI